jgi:hypothetical protein
MEHECVGCRELAEESRESFAQLGDFVLAGEIVALPALQKMPQHRPALQRQIARREQLPRR